MTVTATGTWHPGLPPGDGAGPPPPALPLYPAVRDYAALCEALAAGGFRHAAEALLAPATAESAYRAAVLGPGGPAAGGFLILDGLWLPPERGSGMRHADAVLCREAAARWRKAGDQRADAAGAVLDRLGALADADPMAVRRLVLYQLSCLLADAEGGPTAAAAVALGVADGEAPVLAAAVAAGFPAAGAAREAAELITDAWEERRLRAAADLARALPPGPADPGLARLLTTLRTELAAVDREVEEAAALAAAGSHRAAATGCLRALRRAADDPAALEGLLTAAVRAGDLGEQPLITAAVTDGTVRLTWPAPRRPVPVQVVRFFEDEPNGATEVPLAAGGTAALDADPPTGRPVRYAVLPRDGDRVAGTARASARVLVTPEVTGAGARAVPGGLALTWRAHPSATAFRAWRVTADGDTEVPCGATGLTDRPLPPGAHVYRVSCGYPGRAEGEWAWSDGERITGTAEDWPDQVPEVAVHPAGPDGRVTLSWPAPERGEARLVVWRGRPPAPGDDLSAALGRLSAVSGDGPGGRTATVLPPPHGALRLTAVSVLGERAVAGPSVLLERPGEIEGLTARRLAPGRAEVAFRWPEPAVLVLVAWEGAGGRRERRVSRSQHRAGPVEIPVGRGEQVISAAPVARPDATLAFGTAVATRLPALPLPRLALHHARRAVELARRAASRARRPIARP
ncbi:hypothetical protein [Streptomyces litchfieldiae]|uniref:Uncharacterized protein n=1 Tax=Streptomyces litchfieldiae TaxID=3075543 RepID=A0ABU2MUI8_9ACTN|nr:hypothetical protein [Streptomyces sp. DSM 44938]MDT0345289.1 hypothetical protein [Streptomyces sp. DSM 44938]